MTVSAFGAGTLNRDAARHLALAVQFRNAAPLIAREFDAGDILQQHGRAAVYLDDDVLDIGDAFEIPSAAHHEFVLGEFERAAADIHIVAADGIANFRERDSECAQTARIDDDAVLLDEAADARDLGDPFGLRQPEANFPVLQRAQRGERLVLADDGVLVNPADARRIGAKGRRHACGKSLRRRIQIFEHARAGPVDIRAVFEDNVDERHAEEREPAHDFRSRHRQHRCRQRIGDLVLDDLRRLPRKLRIDDDLRIREVRNRVERQGAHGPDTGNDGKGRRDEDEGQVARRPGDEAGDHGRPPLSSGAVRALSAA